MASDETPQPLPEDAALRAIVEGVESETGDQFFYSLVRHLAAALSVKYAFVSELSVDRTGFRTRAVWGRGDWLPNFEVPIAGTPCEAVLAGEISHHASGLQRLFPDDAGLVTWGVESYCGVPLLNPEGGTVGHLAIMDDRPMRDPRGIAILRIFAARARAEIDRLASEAAVRESEERLSRVLLSALDAIVVVGETGRIELFNEAAERAFRIPTGGAVGSSVAPFLTPPLAAAVDAVRRASRTGSPPYVFLPPGLAARRADGEVFPVEGSVSRVEVGKGILLTLILRDVADRERAESERQLLLRQNEYLQEELKAVHNVDDVVGESAPLRAVLEAVALVAPTDSTVLILGETGTGKELVARAVHQRSLRRGRPLIKANCAAFPAGLIESELFGHEKGAFTGATERRAGRFELAHGGTLFLDEIGEMPPDVQSKLLRVLQEREFERVGGTRTIPVDVRVIAATNRDLGAAVAAGRFREDLFYRLNVFPISVPPLRQRTGDIPLLVHYFVGRFAAKIGRVITRVPRDVMDRLVGYPWPGNVRELENVLERAVILSSGPEIELAVDVLPRLAPAEAAPADRAPVEGRSGPTVPDSGPVGREPSMDRHAPLEDVERNHILAVLKRTRWRIDGPDGAARVLQMNPSTLRSRMKKLSIRRGSRPPG